MGLFLGVSCVLIKVVGSKIVGLFNKCEKLVCLALIFMGEKTSSSTIKKFKKCQNMFYCVCSVVYQLKVQDYSKISIKALIFAFNMKNFHLRLKIVKISLQII